MSCIINNRCNKKKRIKKCKIQNYDVIYLIIEVLINYNYKGGVDKNLDKKNKFKK